MAVALGSDSQESPRKAGHYLLMNVYMSTKVTSYLFLTAMAPNALALSMMSDILKVNLSWTSGAIAACVPGIICLLLTLLVIYKLYPPELKHVDNKSIAEKGLQELGKMKTSEILLAFIFVLALLGWIFAKQLKIDEAKVALTIMSMALIINIVAWDDVLKSKGGWNTLIWYGSIIGMSSVLNKAGFFNWLADRLKDILSFDANAYVVLFVILFISVIVCYLFASGGAYVAAMVPVFATVGSVTGADPMLLLLSYLVPVIMMVDNWCSIRVWTIAYPLYHWCNVVAVHNKKWHNLTRYISPVFLFSCVEKRTEIGLDLKKLTQFTFIVYVSLTA